MTESAFPRIPQDEVDDVQADPYDDPDAIILDAEDDLTELQDAPEEFREARAGETR